MKGIPATVTVVADAIGGTMLLTLLVPVPLLTGLDCLPLRARAALGRLNLLAFAIVAALEAWPGVARRGSHRAFPLPEGGSG